MGDHCAFLIGMGAVGLILVDAAQCKMSTIILPGLLQYKGLVVLYCVHVLRSPVYFLLIEVRAKFSKAFVDPHIFCSFSRHRIPKPHVRQLMCDDVFAAKVGVGQSTWQMNHTCMLHSTCDRHGIADFLKDIGAELLDKGIIDSIKVYKARGHVGSILRTAIELERFSCVCPALFMVI